jgi:hypothetical protein
MRRHVAELPRHFVGDNGPGLADCRGHILDLGRLFDQDGEHRRFLNIFRHGHQTAGDPATRVAALQSGLVDATGLSPPFTLTAKRAGFNVFDSIPALDSLEYPSASLIVRQESVRKDPIVLESYTVSHRSRSFFQDAQNRV